MSVWNRMRCLSCEIIIQKKSLQVWMLSALSVEFPRGLITIAWQFLLIKQLVGQVANRIKCPNPPSNLLGPIHATSSRQDKGVYLQGPYPLGRTQPPSPCEQHYLVLKGAIHSLSLHKTGPISSALLDISPIMNRNRMKVFQGKRRGVPEGRTIDRYFNIQAKNEFNFRNGK